jgi:hypothetical protein
MATRDRPLALRRNNGGLQSFLGALMVVRRPTTLLVTGNCPLNPVKVKVLSLSATTRLGDDQSQIVTRLTAIYLWRSLCSAESGLEPKFEWHMSNAPCRRTTSARQQVPAPEPSRRQSRVGIGIDSAVTPSRAVPARPSSLVGEGSHDLGGSVQLCRVYSQAGGYTLAEIGVDR